MHYSQLIQSIKSLKSIESIKSIQSMKSIKSKSRKEIKHQQKSNKWVPMGRNSISPVPTIMFCMRMLILIAVFVKHATFDKFQKSNMFF